ncbi:bifunctional diaminohydroxyphosphoribosylaminopyrimidine deaminase/5-amino-6-(5-phosphoribosylamino)uracil reductase RibD [Clostridium sp. 19966]|uniref:bifunctional diaminohydroxyphosphoribosylaminopyrimidine deaminase/5-amino-6-(5-phosphoribosylamino)uracil reductase RibD n=1 Tax=Clostridium sp. 19966 TaxID=2768166 RepID=UPI0028E0048F|nr:bifunctional diaminohydroxyphosphoribosylaminopyrimidine deaminase/5-amino-6-(5-phosphoribosylamino)uracil reductase RibD [Clostridium sp. 19966]MDT8717183.1 bifunctional diaminohydroxyphosphoribosylaminopyrimidine deaminase/5-amino-6-(5-phosphoribosylamino)uracil reductase RibD [Clostridium sp. 19966]
MNDIYMRQTIYLAKKGIGFVNPDPLVGAILVKNDKIVGSAYKSFYGEDAVIKAIDNAGEDSANSELYTNFEPDWESVFKSGVKRIYIGALDINPDKDPKNIERIANSGIEVITNVLKQDCESLNEIYLHFISKGTPFVFTKWAMSLDGKIATRTGDSKWISGDESLEFVHHLRQRVAAIMVGENTVRKDNPMLTTRLKGVKISNPVRIILSRHGDINMDANVLKIDESMKTIIVVSSNISIEKENAFLNKGAEIIKLDEVNGRIDFKVMLKELGKRKIDSLYIEGGSGVLGSAFESKIVNKVYVAVAPKIIGGKEAVTAVAGKGIDKMADAIVLNKVTHEVIGSDVIISGYINN